MSSPCRIWYLCWNLTIDERLRFYNEAIRLKPDAAAAFNNRAITRRAKGDMEGALQDFNEEIRLKPNYADAFYNRGNARRDKGDIEGARQDYNKAIRHFGLDKAKTLSPRGVPQRIVCASTR